MIVETSPYPLEVTAGSIYAMTQPVLFQRRSCFGKQRRRDYAAHVAPKRGTVCVQSLKELFFDNHPQPTLMISSESGEFFSRINLRGASRGFGEAQIKSTEGEGEGREMYGG